MENSSMFLQCLLAFVALIVVYNIWFKSAASRNKTSYNNKTMSKTPVVDGAKPIIGHLHLLMGGDLPHHALGRLADKYGPIFLMHIGAFPELVVSSSELAKECFTTNDKYIINRPTNKAMTYLSYEQASVGFAPYGPLWIEMRKISKSNLLSNQRIHMQKQVRVAELDAFFKELYQLCRSNDENNNNSTSHGKVLVEMNKWFEELTLNVVTRMICGKQKMGTKARLGDSDAKHYKKTIDEAAHFMGNLVISDVVPCLGMLDNLLGHVSAMKRTGKELDTIFGSWVEEHQQKIRLSGYKDDAEEEEHDFIDLTLSMMKGSTDLHGLDPATFIKSICVGMILGGTDTTSVALTWILSLLLNNRHILKKAQEELDHQVGKERKVEDSDLNNLVFIGAIVKESMRLYPVGPLIEREAIEDCQIGGVHVKAGTRLLINIWKVQQDPKIWPNPSEFRPERFLDSNMDVKGQHFELIPFGSGRRMCPGMSFAINEMNLVLARLLQGFELETPMNAKVDMTETSSVTNYKGTPLQVLLTPRLSSKLYM